MRRRRGIQASSAALAVAGSLGLLLLLGLLVGQAPAEQASSNTRSFQSGRIDSGAQHTCAIRGDGKVVCWGFGGNLSDSGRLGYANTSSIGDNETPGSAGPVDLGAGRSAVAISAGDTHTCALLDNGSVRCWGDGDLGRLGYANTNDIGDNETPGSVAPVDLGAGRSAIAISAGGAHTCAVLDNGTVRCWGFGGSGQLGYATTSFGTTNSLGDEAGETPGSVGPVDLGAGRSAIAISAGAAHTCAVLDNGTARCWGDALNGQLGYASTVDIGDNETPGSAGPVDLGAGRGAVAISAGAAHTCAVLDNGTVRCWGLGSSGQLGYATTSFGASTSLGDEAGETPGSVGPVNLGADLEAVAISTGNIHTCVVLDNGTVRCWGLGSSGRLGYANTTTIGDNEVPGSAGPVDLGAGRSANAISGGGAHTCALLDNGTVRCWGFGGSGQLGYANTGDIGDNETPGSAGPVDLGLTPGAHVAAVDAGGTHTCALLDNGTVRCWGSGDEGQLGYANVNAIGDNETPGSAGPVDLGAGRSAVAISAGTAHTCALLDNGTVRCWGDNLAGRLGYGNGDDIGDDETPGSVGPVDLGAGRSAVAISAGAVHTCALLDNGTVRCWGSSGFGQLGYGNITSIGDNETPGSAGPVDLGAGRSAVAITAGALHTCALLDNGTLRCWGRGNVGQLGYANVNDIGDNETPGSAGPVDLGAGRSAVAISAGGDHTCALLDNGTVRCWGSALSGRLGYANSTAIGDNETPGSAGPVDLGAGRSAVAISAGAVHTCALLDNGTVRCWGGGTNGRLGYANVNDIGDDETPGSVGPVDLGAGRSAVAISAGGSHTCALLDNGTVRCWGSALSGRLGYPGTTDIGDNETPGSVGPVDIFNDPGTAVNDSATVDEDAGATAIAVLTNDTDIDGGSTIALVSDPANGATAITGGGTGLTYQPDPNYCNAPPGTTPDSFTYTLNGGSQATVSMTVNCADDNPVAVNDSATAAEDSGATAIDVLTNDTDVDGGAAKSIASVSDPANGTTAVTGGGSGLSYQPDANYCNSPPGTTLDSFTYTLTPGGSIATVSVTVNCVDDPGAAVNDSPTVTEDDAATAITVLTNDTDADGGPKTITAVSDPANGTTAITGGGTGLTYAPDANYCNNPPGTSLDTFTYTITPGSSSATVSVTVDCVDDAPVAVNDSATLGEDSGARTIGVLANDTDIDGGSGTVASTSDPGHGTASVAVNGAFVNYRPDAEYCGADSFTYTLNGGSSATVSITVKCDTPRTRITGRPRATTTSHNASFALDSSEPGSRFFCKLDRGRFRRCTSPRRYAGLVLGPHVFRVRARQGGVTDPTPTIYRWRVVRR